MSTDQQQNSNMSLSSSSSSSSKPPLNLDNLKLTRAEILDAFSTIIQEDSSRPATDHAIICLTCNKTIIAKKSGSIVGHLKSRGHVKRQMALDSGLTLKQYSAFSKNLPDHAYASAGTLPFEQQQNYKASTSSRPSVNLDEPGFSREELLTSFPDVIEIDSSHPQPEKAIRCLLCQKTILARSGTNIVNHLKSESHVKLQKALDSGLSPGQYDVVSNFPAGTFRPIGDDTIQCTLCMTNMSGSYLVRTANQHLESDLHLHARTTAAQHEAVRRMTKGEFERFLTQTLFIDCGIPFHMIEKGRTAIEAIIGRPLSASGYFRNMITEMKTAKENEKEGKGEWKRITLPEPNLVNPVKAVQALMIVDTSLNKKKRKGKEQGKVKRQKIKKEIDGQEELNEDDGDTDFDEDGEAVSNINS